MFRAIVKDLISGEEWKTTPAKTQYEAYEKGKKLRKRKIKEDQFRFDLFISVRPA